jgi:hypothetical protein
MRKGQETKVLVLTKNDQHPGLEAEKQVQNGVSKALST